MSEAKFTGGEWCVIDDGYVLLVESGRGEDIATCSGFDPDNTGFNCCNESAANAHLIAAAPDMYNHIKQDIEALKRQCDKYVIGSYELRSLQLRIESKQKILAKARGESC